MIRDSIRRIYRIAVPLLYSRSRFRLFLKATFGEIETRMLTLASQTDYFSGFVKPIPIRAPFGKSVLVVAPHQDDEAIGCGGALALQVRAGAKASIVILQDGGDEHESLGISREEMRDLRNEESRRSAAVLKLDAPVYLNHSHLDAENALIAAEILKLMREQKTDVVFAPFVLDDHPDHRAANYILSDALKSVTWDVRVFGYEVWGMCVPNVMVVIDDAIEEKLRMIACFDLANKAIDYVNSTKGLNMFHSRMLGAGECKYAERFFELPREEYIALVERLRGEEDRRKQLSHRAAMGD